MDSKQRILVVEDDAHIVVFLTDILEYMGYQVSIARNGLDGLEKAKKEMPDLIVLDVMMPGMDGYEVCRRLKADPKTQHIPILMLTAKGQLQDKVKGLDIGADDYLPKPYENSELESRVRALLRRKFPVDKKAAASTLLFLSYARTDRPLVEKIYEALSAQGYKPWMDVHDILGGEDWQHAIYQAIDKCELFIPILSKNSVDRRGMFIKEVRRALDKWNGMLPGDIYVVPLRLDDCPIPEMIQHLQIIEWSGRKGKSKLFEAIDEALARRKQA